MCVNIPVCIVWKIAFHLHLNFTRSASSSAFLRLDRSPKNIVSWESKGPLNATPPLEIIPWIRPLFPGGCHLVGYTKVTMILMILCFRKLVGTILLQPDQNSMYLRWIPYNSTIHQGQHTFPPMDLSWGAEPLTKNIAFEGHEQMFFPQTKNPIHLHKFSR